MEDIHNIGNACLRQGKKLKIEFDVPLGDLEETRNIKRNVKVSCVDKDS